MECGYPDDFRCPISLEVMTDPVILSSGHTFDRASIQRWLDSGNRTCPVTKLPLPSHPALIPNLALRSLISAHSPPQSHKSPSCPPTDLKALARNLSYPSSPSALSALLRLAKSGAAPARRTILDSGATAALLRHAAAGPDDEQDLALRLLLLLSMDGDDARVGLVAEGATDHLVAALRRGGPAAALAATLLTSLAVVDVNKATIGAYPDAVPALTFLLKRGGARECREAATALYALAAFPENRRRAARAGAVPVLVRLAAEGSERAVEVLGLLAKCGEGLHEMKRLENLVKVLSHIVGKGSARSIEHALFVLKQLCVDSTDMARKARNEGMLEICYCLVQKESGKVMENALKLARLLERVE